MRKVLSFVLVLSLVLGSFGMAFAAPASDVVGKDCEDAVNVLTELKVVSGYTDGTYKPENIVTRAEMATLIVKALGLNDYAVGASQFKDCAGHWANGYIGYAASLGIISGRTATTFDPDATVSYNEAATMLVKALGYNDSSLAGVYPASYVSKAKTLGILDDIQAGVKGANRGDCAIMIYQTLDQNIGKTDNEGKWAGIVLKVDENDKATYDNMLNRLDASLYEPAGGKAGDEFVVTKAIAEDAVANVRAYIGANVTAYANDDNEVISIKEVKSTFLTGTFDDLSGSAIKVGTTLTTVDDVEYTVKSGTVVDAYEEFVNGDEDKTFGSLNEADDFTVAVKVSGKKITDIFSVSKLDSDAENMITKDQIAAIDEDHEILDVAFIENDDDEIDLTSFALIGATSLDAIEEDDVVYVYADNDGKVSRIEVGTEVITGTVSKIAGTPAKYTVSGNVYKYAAKTGDTIGTIKAKDEVKFFLDNAGKIYSSELVSGKADKLAIVLDAEAGKDGLSTGADSKIKLYMADGTNKTFAIDEDEFDYAAVNALIAAGTITKGAIIKYDVDKDGLVNAITKTGISTASADKATNGEFSSKGYFEGYKVASDATIFTATTLGAVNGPVVDATSADKDELGVTTLEKVKGNDKVEAYYNLNSDNVIDVIVMQADASSSDDVFAVVLSTYANDSDAEHGIDVLLDGKEASYNATSTLSYNNVLYRLNFNTNGEVKGLDEVTGTAIKDTKVVVSDNTTDVAIKNNVATYNDAGDKVTLSTDVVIYVENKDGDLEKGSLSDVKVKIADSKIVTFYDVYDNDKIVDFIIVK